MALQIVDPYPRPVAQATGPALFLEVAGLEYESRDYAWTDDILCLSDGWSATIPCPDGKATALDGTRVPVSYFTPGMLVRLRESDPAVEGGAKLLKLTGRLVDIADSNDERGGYTVTLSGYDLGWHLTTGHGPVFQNYRGLKWDSLLRKIVTNPADRYGFAGVRLGNLENKSTKIGPRAALEAAKFQGSKDAPDPGAIQPRFQIEPGQSTAFLAVPSGRGAGVVNQLTWTATGGSVTGNG